MEAGFIALGLVQGALTGLNALGLTLVWRTTRVINLAQPAIGLVGGVLTGMLVASADWSFWWAAPLGIAVSALLAFGSERLVLSRLASLPRTVSMVATIGLASLFQALQSGIPFFFDGRLPSYDVDIGVEVFVFPVLLKGPHLLALAALPIAGATSWWFIHRTRVGSAAVAAGQDLERAQSLGVPTGFVRAVAWTVAGTLSGVAGVLSIPVLGFSLGDGVAASVLLLALAPAVLAGLRSLPATAAASLAVGVGYQYALVRSPTAGAADVYLAVVLVAALGLRRRSLDREARSSRATSWAVAADLAPLPRRLRHDRRWRGVVATGALALVALASLPPLWLPPSGDVRYATSASFVLAAVAVSVAWVFAGEIALGHWGIAALGATAVQLASGPLAVRMAAAIAVGVLAGTVLAAVAHRRGELSAAVAGLAVAVAAPYWLTRSGTPTLDLDLQVVAIVGAVFAAVAVVGVTGLRGGLAGVRMVAARDDPRRATGLGVSPTRASFVALGLSGAMAGAAGGMYLAGVPAGIAPGAFDPARSLDVVAFAVVGGLGSALGAGIGAAVLLAAGLLLPAPWGAVATGAGVVWVVLFAPGGLGAPLQWIRDRAARLVRPELFSVAVDMLAAQALPGLDSDAKVSALVAGADTREAIATPTVRAAVVASFLGAAPAIAALFGAPMAAADHLGIETSGLAPWCVLAATGAAAGGAAVGWRGWRASSDANIDVLVPGALAVAVVAVVATRDLVVTTVLVLVAPIAAAWLLARLARLAASTVIPRVQSAASGLVVAGGLAGGVGAAHLATVASGNTLDAAARWGVLYVAGAAFAAAAATGRTPADRARAMQRHAATAANSSGRRRWAPLRIESLTVDFGPRRILDSVDLEVQAGELVALVGGNGAGKSTLLRTVAGFVPPTIGRVDVAGLEVTALRAHERAGAGVAFVSGARPTFPDLTVRDNLRVGGYLTHRNQRAFTATIDHVIDLVPALTDRLDTRAGLLSGGEQRQLAVAQTLFRRPALLLADELTLGLDTGAQTTVMALLRSLADDGIGIVVVDHDLDALTAIADRVALVHDSNLDHFDSSEFARTHREQLPARFLSGASR